MKWLIMNIKNWLNACFKSLDKFVKINKLVIKINLGKIIVKNCKIPTIKLNIEGN